MSDLAAWLERNIQQRGLTLNATAVYSGVSSATISDIINKGHVPRVELLLKLADYFGTPRQEILELCGYLEPQNDHSYDPDILRMGMDLIAKWDEIARRGDEAGLRRLYEIALFQSELGLAMAKQKEQEQADKEEEPKLA